MAGMFGTGMGTSGESWRERRDHAFARHAAADRRRREAEAGQARELIAEFLREARERGLPAGPLTARAYNGRSRYRTGLRGWYLRADRSLAVGIDGELYLLTVPASLRARFTGATVQPQQPRLVVGEGGRDGESIPLRTLLRNRLATP
jgi:hypothetical protein